MSDFWIFAYGSLMWKPGFAYEEFAPARIEGLHRSLCIRSMRHRGTRKRPGLVLGLDNSGYCDGLVFRIRRETVPQTLSYLRKREMVTNVYEPTLHTAKLLDGTGRTVKALCYVVNRRHRQYCGDLPPERQAAIIRRARGKSGANLDYVINTVMHLREMGIVDEKLERVMTRLGRTPHFFLPR